jgi:hypothetical protein
MVVRPLRLCRRAKATAFIVMACVFVVLGPSPTLAATSTWRYDWRPNWLPGDPATSTPDVTARNLAQSGLRVAIDPATGRVARPSSSQRRAANEAFEAIQERLGPEAPLAVDRLPGGGEIVHLQGRFQIFSVARRDPSGRYVTDCADEAATQTLRATPPRATRPREVK